MRTLICLKHGKSSFNLLNSKWGITSKIVICLFGRTSLCCCRAIGILVFEIN